MFPSVREQEKDPTDSKIFSATEEQNRRNFPLEFDEINWLKLRYGYHTSNSPSLGKGMVDQKLINNKVTGLIVLKWTCTGKTFLCCLCNLFF